MALVRLVSAGRAPRRRTPKVTYTLQCRGITVQEYYELLYALEGTRFAPFPKGQIRRLRNPEPPFDPNIVHTIYVYFTKAALGIVGVRTAEYVGRKFIDLLFKIIEQKILAPTKEESKTIKVLYGANGEEIGTIEIPPKKLKGR